MKIRFCFLRLLASLYQSSTGVYPVSFFIISYVIYYGLLLNDLWVHDGRAGDYIGLVMVHWINSIVFECKYWHTDWNPVSLLVSYVVGVVVIHNKHNFF